ncbi:hypothetical protein D3C79_304230 [compost metagenome]
MLHLAIWRGTKAGESGIVTIQYLAQRFSATLAYFYRQQPQPRHAKLFLVFIQAKSNAARSVHMQQRTVIIDDLDAVDAGVEHVLLRGKGRGEEVFFQYLFVDIHAGETPARFSRQGIFGRVERQQKPAKLTAAMAQAAFIHE